TSSYDFARTCVFSKQSLLPGLCGRTTLAREGASRHPAPLLPKLRGHFAEFLNHSSLDRLGILYLTTCVGLGYGPRKNSLEAFLGSMGSPCFASFGYASGLTITYRHGFACGGWLHPYTSTTTHWRGCPPASPHRLTTIGSGPTLPTPSPRKDRRWLGW